MQVDENKRLKFDSLDTYSMKNHPITGTETVDFEDTWKCFYEGIHVFTDKNTPILGWRFLKWGEITSEVKAQRTDETKTFLSESHFHSQKLMEAGKKYLNGWTNCFGFAFLNGEFWLDLDLKTLNRIIEEDNYKEVSSINPNIDSVIVYFKNNQPVHASKYLCVTKQYVHKIGCNLHSVRKNIEINDIYDCNSMRIFVKQES